MKYKLLLTKDLSEAHIDAIADYQVRQTIKDKICPDCNQGFDNVDDAIPTDKVDSELVFSHKSCLTNEVN